MPEIKMKDDLLRSYISYILVEAPLAIFYYSKRQVYYSKQEVNEFCRVAGVLRFTMAKQPVRLRRVIQHLVPMEVHSEQEQADESIVNRNNPAVNNVRDNVDARPTRRNAALNADILRRLRS